MVDAEIVQWHRAGKREESLLDILPGSRPIPVMRGIDLFRNDFPNSVYRDAEKLRWRLAETLGR